MGLIPNGTKKKKSPLKSNWLKKVNDLDMDTEVNDSWIRHTYHTQPEQ